jgi:regulator of sigma E protease
MQPGDRIARVNDVAITDNLSHVIATLAEADAFPMKVVVERGEGDALTQHEMMLTPLYDAHEGRYLIGINIQQAAPVTWQRGNPMEVLQAGYKLCVDAGSAILNGLRDLLLRGKGMGDVSGVVGVTRFIVEETRQAKFEGYLYLMSVISINLGLFNLLPIPGLDGSRLLFLVWEGVRGKPVKREAYVHAIGMLFLLGLMIWINFRDILRLFQ